MNRPIDSEPLPANIWHPYLRDTSPAMSDRKQKRFPAEGQACRMLVLLEKNKLSKHCWSQDYMEGLVRRLLLSPWSLSLSDYEQMSVSRDSWDGEFNATKPNPPQASMHSVRRNIHGSANADFMHKSSMMTITNSPLKMHMTNTGPLTMMWLNDKHLTELQDLLRSVHYIYHSAPRQPFCLPLMGEATLYARLRH